MLGLKRLLAKHGRLTVQLIRDAKDIPSPTTYAGHFQGLGNAYRLAGYEPPSPKRFERKRPYTREELLDKLRGLLQREGQLSQSIMRTDPTIPSARMYQWEFGDLASAYALVGYKQIRIGRPTPRTFRPMPPKPPKIRRRKSQQKSDGVKALPQ